jgi:hypothetical protein
MDGCVEEVDVVGPLIEQSVPKPVSRSWCKTRRVCPRKICNHGNYLDGGGHKRELDSYYCGPRGDL